MKVDSTSLWQVEKRRYARKGLFLIPAVLLCLCFFVVLPHFGKWCYEKAQLADFLRDNLKWVFAPGMTFIHTFSMLTWSAFFYLINKTADRFPFVKKYRTNPTGNWPWEQENWTTEQKAKTIAGLSLHHFVVFPLYMLLNNVLGINNATSLESFPTVWEFSWQILVCIVMEDLGFFWGHYALHTPWLYSRFHKKHHEFKSPFSLVSEYAHPVEFIFGNLVPSSLGLKLIGGNAHIFTVVCWTILRTYITSEAHCGFEIPFSPMRIFPCAGGAQFHDFHHQYNSGALGSFFTYWDRICGTDKEFNSFMLKNHIKQA